MASARGLLHEENFHCSICLSVFTKPVSLPCGHNYCLDCITAYWDTKTDFQCPLCKETFYNRPALRVNIVIAEIVEKLRNPAKENPCSTSEGGGNGKVLCSICTGQRSEALKSCLVCLESYCQTHLERHLKTSALKKHKLISPVENPESRICQMHDEPLELFCTVDQMFICNSCKSGDHKMHKVVSVEEEAGMRKLQLGTEREAADQMILERQQRIHQIQNSVEASRTNAAQALRYSMRVMTAVVDYVKKCQAELGEVIASKQKKNERVAEGFIEKLEEEVKQLQEKSSQLSQVSLTGDPFAFLESFLSLNITVPQVNNWSAVTFESDPFTVQEALAQLQTTVTEEISALCDPDLKEKQRYAVDVTLDPDTANPSLIVSEDRKEVSQGDKRRSLPPRPERFDQVLNVLAKEGFSKGKFYYEVQVKDKTQWDLGVANQSISRKGDIRLSPKTGYWTIWLRKGHEFTANAIPAIVLQVKEAPQKVGVFVDYDGGEVSFYDADTRGKIYSYTGCKFTEEIFPFFSPCSNDGGRNAAPLVITPVKSTS
ncbi:zinc-binding protein A33-like [Betta splendens]|uniref:Zinc-binding protein A33-like n=1 Tax=Betta splendens TaxID=158456 RepID=A0A6P7NPF6_BETSP|nr:zinc-binding protein A33-like [Betta splendens]